MTNWLGIAVVWGVIGLGVLGALVAAVARTVRRDGWGHRPPPAGTPDWAAGSTLDARSSVRIGL